MSIKEKLKGARSFLLGYDPGILGAFYRGFYKLKPNTHAAVIEEQARGIEPFYFLQVGGNDGFINDPVFKFVKMYDWKGIIVEPQKEVFEKRLQRTYRKERKVILENVAIAAQNELRKLYKLSFTESRWATGMASFDREVLVDAIENGNRIKTKSAQEGIELPATTDECITYEEVPCLTIASILEKHGFEKLHLLQIDTEGFDYEIIKTINFEELKPQIISYEHAHLSENDTRASHEILESQGYTLRRVGGDTVAYLG